MASEECCTPAPPAEHIEEGKTVEIGGLQAYINSGPGNATAAIVFVSGIFGREARMSKLADRCAAEGYLVVVPDFLKGDPYVPPESGNPMANVGAWLAKHPATDVGDIKMIVKELRDQGIQSVGATGCCWGAKMVVTLALEESPVIDAGALFHPSLVTSEEVKALKKPTLILVPEIDPQVSHEKAAEWKTSVASKSEVEAFVKIFPEVKHGWTVDYDVNDAAGVRAAHEAHDDMLTWYKKHLKQ